MYGEADGWSGYGEIHTAHQFLGRAAARTPGAVAVRDGGGAWTYRDLLETSRRAGSWLRWQGLARGDRLLVSLPNSRHLVALLYGALSIGAIVVPVGIQSRPFHLSAVAADAQPRLAIAESPQRFESLAVRRSGTRVVTLERMVGELAAIDQLTAAEEAAPEDIALLIYTSGSTAGPKGVVSRHRQVTFAVGAIAERLGYRPDDVVCCRLPFSFDYALYQTFLCAHAGAELVMVESQDELAAFRSLTTFGVTVLPLVPPAAQNLLRLAGRSDAGPALRLITSTGSELTRKVADGLRATFPGVDVVPMYGMTECKRISIAAPNEDLSKPGTVGTPLSGTRVEVVGQNGSVLPVGEVGEIVVRGPHVMDGYWGDPVASTECFQSDSVTGERILFTGDYGSLDEQGALTIVGRRDDVFKRRGVRTSVNEIEAAALDIPEVEEAAAALVGTARRCVLWVRGSILHEHVLKGIGERLEPAKVPDKCLVVDELPRMPSGKIDKKLLKANLEEGR